MKRIIFLAIVILTTITSAHAQDILPQLKREKPDMEQIRREVTDRASDYFFPRLMKEHLSNDTTMKVEKYRRLYLGYMLQEDFNPYREHQVPNHVKALYGKTQKLTRQEADSVITYAQEVLADKPFDLYQILALVQAYRVKGKTNLAQIWNTKLNYILMAIVSTGTGRDKENAWWVMSPQHEYFLLQYLGLSPQDHTFYSPSYEMLTAKDSRGYDAGKFYFNIGTMLDVFFTKYN